MPPLTPVDGEHAPARIEDAQRRMDMMVALNADIFEKAAAYDSAIMIGGFAAFFALWSGVAEHLGKTIVLVSGVLMMVSVLLYVIWHIYRMLVHQRAQRRYAAIVEANLQPAAFEAQWEAARVIAKRESVILLSHWPFIYWPCVATGIGAAAVLAAGSFSSLLAGLSN